MKTRLILSALTILTQLYASIARSEQPQSAGTATKRHELPQIRVSDNGQHFVSGDSGKRFVVWGVNYDHDDDGRLLEDYWHDSWSVIAEDFREIKGLGANVVRIHLQLPEFMKSTTEPEKKNLARLGDLVRLAEQTGLYLDVTGLGCYHKHDVPDWYDELDEPARWDVQARFWKSVAQVCKGSPAIFCSG